MIHAEPETAPRSETTPRAMGPARLRLPGLRSLVGLALLGAAALASVATSAQSPVITRVTPAMGDSSVAVDQPLEVELERPVDPDSATPETVRLRRLSDDALVEATLERAEGGRRLVLRPTAPLAQKTDYALELDLGALRSEDGEAYAGLRYDVGSASVWETSGVLSVPFTTRAALSVARAFLQDDPSEILVYFSEAVNPATLTLESVTVEQGGVPVPIDLRYSEAENRLRLIPLAPLRDSGTCTVRLSASIASATGGALGGGAGDELRFDPTEERIR